MEPLVSMLHKKVNQLLIFLQISRRLEELKKLEEISIVRFDSNQSHTHHFFYYIIFLIESFAILVGHAL
jgi:hypothetical protein